MRLAAAAFACLAAAAAPAAAWAQGGAECATVECARTAAADAQPAVQRLMERMATARAAKVQFAEAVQAFAVAHAAAAGHVPAWDAHLASMRAALERWDREIAEIETAAASQLRHAGTHIILGTVYLDRHRVTDALRAFGEAARADAERPDAHAWQAATHLLAGQLPEATRALRTASSLDARDAALAYSLAHVLRDAGRPDEAREALQRFVRLRSAVPIPAAGRGTPAAPFQPAALLRQAPGAAPVFAFAGYTAAFARFETGDYAGGIDALAAAVEADPPAGEHYRRGITAWVTGDHNGAVRDLRSAIEERPGDERGRLALAFVLREADRPSEAEQVLRETIAAFPRAGLPWYRLGQLLESQARVANAARAFDESLSRGPIAGRDALLQRLARTRVNQADFDAAIAAYTARLSINPNSGEAHRSLGEIYYLQGRDDEALAEFLAAVWIDPNDARGLAALGKVHVRAGRYADAVPALRRAIALDPARADAHYALGQALARVGRADEARRETGEFQRLDAEERARGQRDFRIEQDRVEAARLVAAGEVPAALDVLRRLAEEDPENPRWLRDQGAALLRARRFTEAVSVLEAAQARRATVETARLLSDALAAAGRTDEARQLQARYDEAMREARLEQLTNPETGP